MLKTPNDEQTQVIENLSDNILLFASAGTGKTFTVANRMNEVLSRNMASPEEILCLSFTVKACAELTEDIARYAGAQARQMTVKTIHGFCLSFLREEAKRNNAPYVDISVCDDVDTRDMVSGLISAEGAIWRLEEILVSKGIFSGTDELFNHDVVCAPAEGGGGFGFAWRVANERGEQYLLFSDGGLVPDDGTALPFSCPECGQKHESPINVCDSCGVDYRRIVKPFRPSLLLASPEKLYEIVSAIKHSRFDGGFFSDDEIEDYSRSVARISEKLREMCTYYDREDRVERFDGDIYDFLLRYGGRLLGEYCGALRLSNCMDYDDLIINAAHLLDDDEVRGRWEGCFKYITVDEMQDTSSTEYYIIDKLAGDSRVMMCGDFFQTIYEWRGSRPAEILSRFKTDYGAVTYMFRENYRSTRSLANASFAYLRNMYPDMVGKYCPPELSIHSAEPGEKIFHYEFSNYYAEARQLFDYLRTVDRNELSSVCVMARSRRYIAELAEYFDDFNARVPEDEKKLSFFTVERDQAFYKTAVIKDLLAFLRIVMNNTDNISMERIARRFIKGAGVKTIEQIRNRNEIGVTLCAYLNPDTYELGDTYHKLINAALSGNIVVFDTETTGLDLSRDEVIQIAAVRFDCSGNAVDSFEEIVIPSVEISQGARDIIPFDVDKEIRERGIPAGEAFARFSDFVRGSVLVGHNSSEYDSPLVRRQLRELDLPPLDTAAEYDTLVLAKQFYTKAKNYKLATLCEDFQLVNEDAHNAIADVKATGRLLFHMLNERIIPSREERVSFLAKHVKKFRAFFDFKLKMDACLEQEGVQALVKLIIENCILKRKYSGGHVPHALAEATAIIGEAEISDDRAFLLEFLSNAALNGSQLDGLIKKLRRVPLITVHQTKGCEFDTVVIAGADNMNFPSYAAVKSGKEEEESRVFYVAISRAKKRLILTNVYIEKRNYTIQASPYIGSIPREYVRFVDRKGFNKNA